MSGHSSPAVLASPLDIDTALSGFHGLTKIGSLWDIKGVLQIINRGQKLLIFDLLHFEEGTEGAEGIPTSVRLDPSRRREADHLLFLPDLDVVLYRASPNHFRSSRVALELKRLGVRKIAVLAVGLNAWREQGLPTTHDLISS